MSGSDFKKKKIVLGEGLYITDKTEITGASLAILELFAAFGLRAEGEYTHYKKIRFSKDTSEKTLRGITEQFSVPYPRGKESHLVLARGEEITVYASTDRGLLYGAVSLLHLSEGGMEYRRHPEINAGWVDYCREMAEYSGKTTVIQNETFPWYKNAIHMENGDGGFLSQEALKELVCYCREREMEVIPEVPSLGHCDYLMMGNPEIAERQEDPYPDTYCPSNPKSYQILFDVIDEVISVFNPSVMNIGHDEYYTIGICEKCRTRTGADIFADDVNKIVDYLRDRNIRTVIWGDKLLKNAVVPGAGSFGGAEIKMYSPAFHIKDGKFIGIMPATFQAVHKINKDIGVLHWNWGLSETLEDELLSEGFSIRYGNFDSYLFPNWHAHMKKGSCGAVISNWSTLNEKILQRNGIFFNIAYAYEMFWNPDYNEADFEKIRKDVMENLYYLKNPELKKCSVCSKFQHPPYVELLYNTDYHPDFKWFVDGVFPEDAVYEIGAVRFIYADGTTAAVPIKYGENIGYRYASWERTWDESQAMYKVDDHLIETTYGTYPVRVGEETFYRHLFKNPCPEKELLRIEAEQKEGKSWTVFIKQIHIMKYKQEEGNGGGDQISDQNQ